MEDDRGFKTGQGKVNNLLKANDTILTAKYAKELQALVMKVKEGSENMELKFKYLLFSNLAGRIYGGLKATFVVKSMRECI